MKLLNFFYDINYRLARNNSIWEKLQVRRALRVTIKIFSNLILPYLLSKSRSNLDGCKESKIVISLTSFPKRIDHVWLAIETMLCQTYKPSAIVLWLSKIQFPNEMDDIPQSLLNQTKRGLQIRFVEGDIRSHKKYFYAFHEYRDKYVVTIDDDMFFPTYFLDSMIKCKEKHMDDIIASYGSHFEWNKTEGRLDFQNKCAETNTSMKDVLFGTGGGTLFEPSKFIDIMDTLDTIVGLCPTEDDMYLNALMKAKDFNITFHMNGPLLNIRIPNNSTLMQYNGSVGDMSSNNTKQVNNIVNHMIKKFGFNPFEYKR